MFEFIIVVLGTRYLSYRIERDNQDAFYKRLASKSSETLDNDDMAYIKDSIQHGKDEFKKNHRILSGIQRIAKWVPFVNIGTSIVQASQDRKKIKGNIIYQMHKRSMTTDEKNAFKTRKQGGHNSVIIRENGRRHNIVDVQTMSVNPITKEAEPFLASSKFSKTDAVGRTTMAKQDLEARVASNVTRVAGLEGDKDALRITYVKMNGVDTALFGLSKCDHEGIVKGRINSVNMGGKYIPVQNATFAPTDELCVAFSGLKSGLAVLQIREVGSVKAERDAQKASLTAYRAKQAANAATYRSSHAPGSSTSGPGGGTP